MSTNLNQRVKHFLNSRTSSREDRHRLMVFLLAMLTGLLGFPLHILGVWGSGRIVLQLLSIGNWLALLVVLLLFLSRRLSLYAAFTAYGIAMQTFLTTKIIYISCVPPPGASYLILFNSFISMLIILVMVMGFMRTQPFVITLVSLVTGIVARIIDPSLVQLQFFLFFIFVEMFSCALGFMAWRDLHEVERENANYREEEGTILRTLRMNKQELTAYLSMSKVDNPSQADVDAIFSRLDHRSMGNILRAVRMHDTEMRLQTLDIAGTFPTLSPTEQEVCRMVMKGMTLAEIASLTGKTVNNVSSVRIHIRKKLALEPGQDLRQFLEENVKKKEEGEG